MNINEYNYLNIRKRMDIIYISDGITSGLKEINMDSMRLL